MLHHIIGTMHTVIDNKNYTIVLTTNFSAQLAQFINSNTYSKVVYLFDTNTFRLYGNLPCFDATQSIVIPSGESYKTIETCNEVWQQLLHLNADRNTLLVNVGGGMVSDLGGFVASTYKRGIHFINLPTTLLACVDASIGGKTAVNCGDTKNIIGAFAPVLPPMAASTCANKVVGIFIKSMPRMKLAATNPPRSVIMPPPRLRSRLCLSAPKANNSAQISPAVASSFVSSPAATVMTSAAANSGASASSTGRQQLAVWLSHKINFLRPSYFCSIRLILVTHVTQEI